MSFKPLPRKFYRPSASVVARDLLGHILVTRIGGMECAGIIVETEGYVENDPACHAFGGKTKRNAVMWGEAGHAYVYFIYGNHFCFNAVCCVEGIAEAVLIRAIQPILGTEEMVRRRGRANELTNGPGKLCSALGIRREHDGLDLTKLESDVFIARNDSLSGTLQELGPIIQTTRIGITKAAELPLRYYLEGSGFVSKRAIKAGS